MLSFSTWSSSEGIRNREWAVHRPVHGGQCLRLPRQVQHAGAEGTEILPTGALAPGEERTSESFRGNWGTETPCNSVVAGYSFSRVGTADSNLRPAERHSGTLHRLANVAWLHTTPADEFQSHSFAPSPGSTSAGSSQSSATACCSSPRRSSRSSNPCRTSPPGTPW
jgi:hypothetical protein